MFFYVSLVLVIVAAVTLVIGLLSSGLPLVIVSIASSFLAGVFLILTVMRDRPAAPVEGAAPAVPVGGGDDEDAFPIAEYDDLKVSEIVPLLPELDDDELEVVRGHEERGKARATVLGRIDELLAEADEAWEPGEDEFPIAEYDDLKVNEIVPLLPELDDDELELVREREEGGKARASVLGRIAELLGEEPAPAKAAAKSGSKSGGKTKAKGGDFPIAGYDKLTVADVAKKLKKLDADELAAVKAYEKKNKGRKGVLDKLDAELASR